MKPRETIKIEAPTYDGILDLRRQYERAGWTAQGMARPNPKPSNPFAIHNPGWFQHMSREQTDN